MFRLVVSSPPDRLAETIRTIRRHTDLAISEIRARLAAGKAIAEFHFWKGLEDIRRCRSFLRDLAIGGATVRVFEHVDGFGEHEESLTYLRNRMRHNIQIHREVREDIEREVAADSDDESPNLKKTS